MDRRFLSDPAVINASRAFVCVRLATYESAVEARFLETLFVGRTGEVENTTFALLTPDAKPLVRSGRSPAWVFQDARTMAAELNRLGRWYAKTARTTKRALPTAATVRLGLNVAACDRLPLLVVVERDPKALSRLRERAAKAAWSPALQGRLVYAATTQPADLQPIPTKRRRGYLLVRPDAYGQRGTVVRELPADTSAAALTQALTTALVTYRAPKRLRNHIEVGRKLKVRWTPKIPVTDPHDRRGPPRR